MTLSFTRLFYFWPSQGLAYVNRTALVILFLCFMRPENQPEHPEHHPHGEASGWETIRSSGTCARTRDCVTQLN
jgi:hypothetical protein